MRFGSLFAGIGGIDLGLERAGMECVWQVEIDPYCQKVLEKHWLEVKRYGDIKECGAINLDPVDLICGGFPCQDISYAGKGAGIEGKRSGLWKEFYRVICELRPRFVLVENVPALLRRGLNVVLGDLASCGYDAEWESLSAAAFGAPHIRERVFILAYPNGAGSGRKSTNAIYQERRTNESRRKGIQEAAKRKDSIAVCDPKSTGRDVADASCEDDRRSIRETSKGQIQQPRKCLVKTDVPNADQHGAKRNKPKDGQGCGIEQSSEDVPNTQGKGLQGLRREFELIPRRAAKPPTRGCCEASSEGSWESEPNVGRVAHGVPSRVDRLKCLGNAVVPQVAEWIGRQILEAVETCQ